MAPPQGTSAASVCFIRYIRYPKHPVYLYDLWAPLGSYVSEGEAGQGRRWLSGSGPTPVCYLQSPSVGPGPQHCPAPASVVGDHGRAWIRWSAVPPGPLAVSPAPLSSHFLGPVEPREGGRAAESHGAAGVSAWAQPRSGGTLP